MIQNNSYDADTLHEECGVFGMYDFDGADVASTIYYGRARFFPTREWDL